MTFVRPSMLIVCFTVLLTCVAPRIVPGPRVAPRIVIAQTAPSPAAAPAPAPANPQNAYSLSPDKLAKAIAISRIRNIMDIVGGLWGLAVLWLLLSTRTAARIEAWAQRISPRRWIQGLVFFAASLIITFLANQPLDWFSQHVEKHFGISVQGWGSWLGDQAKALGLTLLIGAPVLLLFNWIVRRWPRRYWFGVWVATLPLLVLSIFVSPLLEPLFNKFEPLTKNNAGLVTELEKVVARTGTNIPPDRMFLMKASVKTNGLNAYVTGLGATKRIVVWDTTAGRVPNDEVLFIFGHESGHYVLHHIPKLIAGMAFALFFVYWACAGFASWLACRFGSRWQLGQQQDGTPLATRAGFIVLMFAISVAGFLLEPANSTFSRHFEHQADVYGQEAIHGVVADPQKTAVSAFNHLGEAWLEDPNPNPFIEFWEYGHPSTQNRAIFAEHYDPWANGGHGEFFDK
ncbi:MAG TPA: M48 family metallopeptidase [Terracidiphilus sp.]|nr:M48 family metallopeptidase [Terracidiphilus sp.]